MNSSIKCNYNNNNKCLVPESPITETICWDVERVKALNYIRELEHQCKALESTLVNLVTDFKHLFLDEEESEHVRLYKHLPELEVPHFLSEMDKVRYVYQLLLDFVDHLHEHHDEFHHLTPYLDNLLDTMDVVLDYAGNGIKTVSVPEFEYVKPSFEHIPQLMKTFYRESKTSFNLDHCFKEEAKNEGEEDDSNLEECIIKDLIKLIFGAQLLKIGGIISIIKMTSSDFGNSKIPSHSMDIEN